MKLPKSKNKEGIPNGQETTSDNLHADDVILLAHNGDNLQRMLFKFNISARNYDNFTSMVYRIIQISANWRQKNIIEQVMETESLDVNYQGTLNGKLNLRNKSTKQIGLRYARMTQYEETKIYRKMPEVKSIKSSS